MSERPPAAEAGYEGVGEGMQSLIHMLGILFFLLRGLIVVILVWLVFSGVFYVKSHEEAMLFRFGKLTAKADREKGTNEVLTSGQWYWAWPYPIDQVRRIPAQRSITLTTGTQFLARQDPNRIQSADPAAPPPEAPPSLLPGMDGYAVSGDANIVHMVWSVSYRVIDAKKYYLRFYDSGDPAEDETGARRRRSVEGTIVSVLADAAVTETAGMDVDRVLVREREALAAAVKQQVVRTLDEIQLGVEVQQVVFDVQPPAATMAAFREVADAAVDYQRQIDEAKAYEKGIVPQAEGFAAKVIAEAEAYRTRTVASVKAEKAYFQTVLTEYRKNPKTMLVALYTDAIRDVLTRVDTKWVIPEKADGRQEIRLMLGPEPERPPSAAEASPASREEKK